jgi:chemotaxis protein CheX
MQLTPQSPVLVTPPFQQKEMSVLIGVAGDLRGRLILDADRTVFGAIGAKMFGMELSGDMLDSFTGELGNMIAGNMATHLAERQVTVDITPPTVLVGQTKITGFKKAISVPVLVEGEDQLHLVLIMEE